MQIRLVLGLSFVLATPCLAQDADGWGPTETVVPTTLTAIRATPGNYLNVQVTFAVQFASMGKVQNPFFTRFVPSEYVNFHAWAAEQPIWRKPAFDDAFGLMFVNKANQQVQGLFKLGTYDRLRVTAVVRDLFQGEPWMEVTSFEPLASKVNTATLAHLYRGEQLMKKHDWARAVSELSLAPLADIPDFVRGNVHKDLGVCYLRIGEGPAAMQHLDQAVSMLGDDGDTDTRRLAKIAHDSPLLELDHDTKATALKDHERPMWEAFEDVSADETLPQDG